jgi:hypothetical protein
VPVPVPVQERLTPPVVRRLTPPPVAGRLRPPQPTGERGAALFRGVPRPAAPMKPQIRRAQPDPVPPVPSVPWRLPAGWRAPPRRPPAGGRPLPSTAFPDSGRAPAPHCPRRIAVVVMWRGSHPHQNPRVDPPGRWCQPGRPSTPRRPRRSARLRLPGRPPGRQPFRPSPMAASQLLPDAALAAQPKISRSESRLRAVRVSIHRYRTIPALHPPCD